MPSRRTFLVVTGLGLVAGLTDALARQRSKVWRIGYLTSTSGRSTKQLGVRTFRQGMRELGYVEGKNLVIDLRFAGGRSERLPVLAAELAQLKPDVIVVHGTAATAAAQKATSTIPIVMVNVSDPVANGFVKSLARPGGNITGTTSTSSTSAEFGSEHLEMLLAMVPKLSRVAILVHPDDRSHLAALESIRSAARRSSVEILQLEARTGEEIESAFSVMSRRGTQAVIVNAGLFVMHRRRIADLAAKHRLPSIAAGSLYAKAGGLMSYGPDMQEGFRRAVSYVDRILKGAKPGDLPVEQPTKFDLMLNLKTAKALGLTIPPSILIRVDRVIE